MFHPPRLREMLGELRIGSPKDPAVLGDHEGCGARGTLIDGEKGGDWAHGCSSGDVPPEPVYRIRCREAPQ